MLRHKIFTSSSSSSSTSSRSNFLRLFTAGIVTAGTSILLYQKKYRSHQVAFAAGINIPIGDGSNDNNGSYFSSSTNKNNTTSSSSSSSNTKSTPINKK